MACLLGDLSSDNEVFRDVAANEIGYECGDGVGEHDEKQSGARQCVHDEAPISGAECFAMFNRNEALGSRCGSAEAEEERCADNDGGVHS
jgi:hypothetical protein